MIPSKSNMPKYILFVVSIVLFLLSAKTAVGESSSVSPSFEVSNRKLKLDSRIDPIVDPCKLSHSQNQSLTLSPLSQGVEPIPEVCK